MQAKLDVYMWLGQYEPEKTVKEYMRRLPPGYQVTDDMARSPQPPSLLIYPGECPAHNHPVFSSTLLSAQHTIAQAYYLPW